MAQPVTLLPAPRRRAPSMVRPLARRQAPFDVLLVGLYSSRYAAIGESHGLSVIGGVLTHASPDLVGGVAVLDMAAHGEEQPARIVAAVVDRQPDVIGVAVPYGAFSVLEQAWPEVSAALPPNTLVVFGGALPTYLAADVLDIEPNGVVVNGEGEEPLLALLAAWRTGRPLYDVPGITWRMGDETISTERSLADLSRVPPPYRDHVDQIARSGGQVYVESSRACSWAACTFCLRGLTDIDGKPREHRRFPAERLAEDFYRLAAMGIDAVVFADEDFLGHDLVAAERFVDRLAPLLPAGGPSFEISTTINSVYSHSDTRAVNVARGRLLQRLCDLGLRKVFLGIESGSDSQLRRYAKGHVAEECAAAIYRVRAADLRLEVGFIMFDPLCTIAEVAENVSFIRRTGIIDAISAVDNELRLQQGARYLKVLERHEHEMARVLYDRAVDRDTLSHRYDVADREVARLLAGLRPWTQGLHGIAYPAKNISRHGEDTPAAGLLRGAVVGFKAAALDAIEAGVHAVGLGADPARAVDAGMILAGQALAAGVIAASESLPQRQLDHPVIASLIDDSRRLRHAPRAFVAG